VTVVHALGTTSTTINQQDNLGQFQSVGTYHFTAGFTGTVSLTGAGADGLVSVDAIRFELVVPAEYSYDTETAASEVTLSSSGWGTGSSSGQFQGSSYHWSASSAATCEYRPVFTATATYEVLVSFSGAGSRSNAVPHTVVHADGTTVVNVDQTVVQQYYSLGRFRFSLGNSGSVTVSSPGSGTFSVDSCKFVLHQAVASQVFIDTEHGEPTAIVSSFWAVQTSTQVEYQGANYLTSSNTQETVTFVPDLPFATDYLVYVTFGGFNTRSTTCKYTVTHSGGSTDVLVDQTSNSGEPRYLGQFSMVPSQLHRVMLTPNGGSCSADSIRFVAASARLKLDSENDGDAQLTYMYPSSNPVTYFEGTNYHYGVSLAGSGVFSAPVANSGEYAVMVTFGAFAGRDPAAGHTVSHATGTSTTLLDQTIISPSYRNVGNFQLSSSITNQLRVAATTDSKTFSVDSASFILLDEYYAQPEIFLDSEWTNEMAVGVRGYWGRSNTVKHKGDNYFFASPANLQSQVIFKPIFFTEGTYEVFVTYGGWVTRATNAPYTIVHASGTNTVTIAQTDNLGLEKSLGTFTFAKGGSNSVTVTPVGADSIVAVDSIRFVRQ